MVVGFSAALYRSFKNRPMQYRPPSPEFHEPTHALVQTWEPLRNLERLSVRVVCLCFSVSFVVVGRGRGILKYTPKSYSSH